MASWVTFDCYGTLIDWNAGLTSALEPLARGKTAALLGAYHRAERLLEAEKPHRLYKDVLASSLRRAAAEVGAPVSEAQAGILGESWHRMAAFPDVEPMLAALRKAHYRLAVLTNCDDDLFAGTERTFSQPFDMVVTAEKVKDYKPSLTHFLRFAEAARPGEWVHVACSWHHDIVPARQMGIPRIWLDRDRTGEDPEMASARVQSAADVASTIASLL